LHLRGREHEPAAIREAREAGEAHERLRAVADAVQREDQHRPVRRTGRHVHPRALDPVIPGRQAGARRRRSGGRAGGRMAGAATGQRCERRERGDDDASPCTLSGRGMRRSADDAW
jgi:hypothetical protein